MIIGGNFITHKNLQFLCFEEQSYTLFISVLLRDIERSEAVIVHGRHVNTSLHQVHQSVHLYVCEQVCVCVFLATKVFTGKFSATVDDHRVAR